MDNVVFFRKDGVCYFRYKGYDYLFGNKKLVMLKNNLKYPANFVFKDISLEKAKNIIDYFNDWNVNVDFRVIEKKDEGRQYLAILSLSFEEKLVPVYKVNSINDFKVVDNTNPYYYDEGLLYLFEVDVNIIRNNDNFNYYWLDKDLTDKQKVKLSNNYREIWAKAIYRYNRDAMNSNNVKRLVKNDK